MPPRLLTAVLLLLLTGAAAGSAEPWMGQTIRIVPDVYTEGSATPTEVPSGERVFAEAQAAAELGEPSRAFELATLALHADPDHANARQVLGYESVEGEWLTPYQAKQHARGYRWDGRFGWLRREDLPRYQAGERRDGRRWTSSESDAAARREIEDGWMVRTDHFVVRTNHTLEAGARLAADLEGLFQVWRQSFAGYWLKDREVRALFAGERAARKRSRPMRVDYHRDQASYVESLRRQQPRIAETLGIYFDNTRTAHFYHDDDPDQAGQLRATLYHEATHQLFAENGPGRRGAGRDANFGLIEGVACYFELLAPIAGKAAYTFGNPSQGRLPSAVAGGPVLPLAELTALGQTDLQRQPDLPALYAQATGVIAMLRHGESQDREALVRTLRAVYGGQPDGGELARQAGQSFAELDKAYRRFLANLSR